MSNNILKHRRLAEIFTRREFITQTVKVGSGLLLAPTSWLNAGIRTPSHVYWAEDGTPDQNMEQVLSMLGGISSWISPNDIVIIKPNCQWWNQGTANLTALRRLIELILLIPGFSGEIIIAENHQKSGPDSRGWTAANEINDDAHAVNINALIDYFHSNHFFNVTKYHWLNSERGGRIIEGPAQGDGYVHSSEKYSHDSKSTPMTYPVFTSSFSRAMIDLKQGIWANGGYTGQTVRLINLSSLNHHAFGVTASVKNLMGIVDLAGNDHGRFADGSYNFHSIGVEGMGGALGAWLKSIIQPTLNIITAEWVGWGSRVEPAEAVRARSIIASTDPVALDYWASKYILHALTPDHYGLKAYHNPDYPYSPFRTYLLACQAQGAGTMNPNDIILHYHQFSTHVKDKPTGGAIQINAIYPNPVHTQMTVAYTLHRQQRIYLTLWNARGQCVERLIEGRAFQAGQHRMSWQVPPDLANGVYVVQLQASEHNHALRLVIQR